MEVITSVFIVMLTTLVLISPTITGLPEMLKICELYANNYDIIFNAKKVKSLYFGCNSSIIPDTANLVMQNGQVYSMLTNAVT